MADANSTAVPSNETISAGLTRKEKLGCDIWDIYAHVIATLAMVDCMADIEDVEASEELPAVRCLLREMKSQLQALANNLESVEVSLA